MPKEDKKMAVLHQISQESEPIGLTDLLKKLNEDFVERTVRRWLVEMVDEGLVEKLGHKRATKYRVIQRSCRLNSKVNNCFSSESRKIVQQIRRPIYERNPITYVDDWLEDYQPNITFHIPLEYRMQLEKAGQRVRREDPAGTYAHQIFNRLLIDL